MQCDDFVPIAEIYRGHFNNKNTLIFIIPTS